MSLFCRLSRRHYWCTPHRRSADRRLVQVCYECGAERPANEIVDDFASERINHAMLYAKAEAARLSSQRFGQQSSRSAARPEPIAVGQTRATKFLLVK